jgi:hypothetical protein
MRMCFWMKIVWLLLSLSAQCMAFVTVLGFGSHLLVDLAALAGLPRHVRAPYGMHTICWSIVWMQVERFA